MLGFIIARHVNSEKTNMYWIECVNKIREFYPENTILIIDDYSDYSFINNDNVNLTNCIIVQSEYKGRAEFLPYYYFYKLKPFDQAVVINDSTFFTDKIYFGEEDVKFLWHFHSSCIHCIDTEYKLLLQLNNNEGILDYYLNKRDLWAGCFATMCVIKHDFLQKIFNKYNLSVWLEHIITYKDRCCLERAFALICCYEYPQIMNDISYLGNILNPIWGHSKYLFDDYLNDKTDESNNNINKCLKLRRIWSNNRHLTKGEIKEL